jgi:hypothetical protein
MNTLTNIEEIINAPLRVHNITNVKFYETEEEFNKAMSQITQHPVLRDKSLELVPAINDIAMTLSSKHYSFKRWTCNKNMTTVYIDNKQAIEIVLGRKCRVSTKKSLNELLPDFSSRNSGYGMDLTKEIKVEELATEFNNVVKAYNKFIADKVDKTK